MDSAVTEYPVEIVSDEEAEEIESLLTTEEVNLGRAEEPVSLLLSHIDTIEWLREIGVSGDFSITFPL